MTINYTTLLGLAKPVTGTETGQWGDVVNDEITTLLEDAVANAATFSVTSGNVTLTTTNGASNQARMSTLIITGTPGTTRNVIAPSQAKIYQVINQSDGAVVIKGSATTGVTIAAGATGTVVWNGSDFVEVNSTSSGRIIKGNLQVTGNLQVDGNTTLGDAAGDTITINGATTFANVNPTLSGGTASGVAYLNGSKVLTTGSALTFDGTNLGLGNSSPTYRLDLNSATVDSSTLALRIFRGGVSTNWSRIDNISGVANFRQYDSTTPIFIWSTSTDGSTWAEQMRLTSTGLGIGTSSPGYKLDVNGAARVSGNFTIGGFVGYIGAAGIGTGGNWRYSDDTGTFRWLTGILGSPGATSFNIYNIVSNQTALTVDTSNNLGIGTSSPATKLDVNGSISIASTGNLTWGGAYGAGIPTIAVPSAGSLGFYPNGSTSGLSMVLNSSGNLGIGTSSPSAKLTVSGGAIRLSDGYEIGWGDNSAYIVGNGASDTLQFITASSERMRLDSSGNLGLGVTPSAWNSPTFRALDIGGSRSAGFSGSDDATYISTNAYNNGGWKFKGTSTGGYRSALYQQFDGSHQWFYGNTGTAGNAISFTQAMTLDASGNLALGHTNSSSARLDARISTASTTAVTDVAYFFANSTGSATSTFGARIGLYTQNANGNSYPASIAAVNDAGGSALTNLAFYTYNGSLTERARIDSTGKFIVGNTSFDAGAVGFGAAPNGDVYMTRSESTNSYVTNQVYSTGAAAYRFYVGMAGTVYATNTTISAISDIRFKENVRDLDVGLDKIMALKPRLYDWKEGKGANIKNARGFIAQEFEQVFPDLIDEWKDPAPEGEEPYKSVRQDLIPVLVKAIQEQQAIIEQLKARLDAANL